MKILELAQKIDDLSESLAGILECLFLRVVLGFVRG